MNNSTTIIKGEIAFLLKEFKKLIELYNDKVEDYLKSKYYFQDIEEIINYEDTNKFNKINFEYFNLAKEFRNFVLRYNVSHDHITELVLNDIIKRPIEYILHRRQSEYDSNSETNSDSEDEEIIDKNLKHSIDTALKQQTDDISKENSLSNNLKQLLIDNLLKQSMINKILKHFTINNKESTINDILNKNTINNNENTFVETPKCIRYKKTVLNPKINDNNSFQYSITLSLYQKEIGNNFNSVTKTKLYINNFNWNNINFPPTEQDYETFEINNLEISLNIYQLHNEEISQLYKSDHNRIKEINLV